LFKDPRQRDAPAPPPSALRSAYSSRQQLEGRHIDPFILSSTSDFPFFVFIFILFFPLSFSLLSARLCSCWSSHAAVLLDSPSRLTWGACSCPSLLALLLFLSLRVCVCALSVAGPDLVLFFEFKHYKPSKKKISTRCFALMEAKEMVKAKDQPGVCLELSAGTHTDWA